MALPPIGVFLPSVSPASGPVQDVVAAARHAEALGFDSVWVVDQLIDGSGNGVLSSALVLAAAAAATERIKLGFGILVAPLRSPMWLAKDIASLQHLSNDRVILGVGVGADTHEQSWMAAGVQRADRGRRLDAALAVLPNLIAGKEVDGVRLAPAATVPPIIVGGMSPAAIRRAQAHHGWLPMQLPPDALRGAIGGVDVPVTATLTGLVISDDETAPSRQEVVHRLTQPDSMPQLPLEVAEQYVVYGDVSETAAVLQAYGDAGPERLAVLFAAGDWFRQAELLAEAGGLR